MRPTTRGRGPSAPSFESFLLFMCAFFVAELYTKFDVVTHMERGCILGSATPTSPIPKQQSTGAPNFLLGGISVIYAYTL